MPLLKTTSALAEDTRSSSKFYSQQKKNNMTKQRDDDFKPRNMDENALLKNTKTYNEKVLANAVFMYLMPHVL